MELSKLFAAVMALGLVSCQSPKVTEATYQPKQNEYKHHALFLKTLAEGWTLESDGSLVLPTGRYQANMIQKLADGSQITTYQIEPGTSVSFNTSLKTWTVARIYKGKLSLFSGVYQ